MIGVIGMDENVTAAQRRQQEEREARTAEIRRLLDESGSEAVAKKFGKSALGSDEYKAAQRQRQLAQARRREAAEARVRDARQQGARQSAQKSGGADRPRTRQEMIDAQRKFQRSGVKVAERGRDQVHAQAM